LAISQYFFDNIYYTTHLNVCQAKNIKKSVNCEKFLKRLVMIFVSRKWFQEDILNIASLQNLLLRLLKDGFRACRHRKKYFREALKKHF